MSSARRTWMCSRCRASCRRPGSATRAKSDILRTPRLPWPAAGQRRREGLLGLLGLLLIAVAALLTFRHVGLRRKNCIEAMKSSLHTGCRVEHECKEGNQRADGYIGQRRDNRGHQGHQIKARSSRASFVAWVAERSAANLDHPDVRGCRAFRAIHGVEADLLRFLERLVAVHLDVAVMGEELLAAVIRRDEPEALGVVEPFHGACRHNCYSNPELKCATAPKPRFRVRYSRECDCHDRRRLGAAKEGTADSCLNSYALNVTQLRARDFTLVCARRSPARAAVRGAGREGGNSESARRTRRLTGSGASSRDRDRRRSVRGSSRSRCCRAGSRRTARHAASGRRAIPAARAATPGWGHEKAPRWRTRRRNGAPADRASGNPAARLRRRCARAPWRPGARRLPDLPRCVRARRTP